MLYKIVQWKSLILFYYIQNILPFFYKKLRKIFCLLFHHNEICLNFIFISQYLAIKGQKSNNAKKKVLFLLVKGQLFIY